MQSKDVLEHRRFCDRLPDHRGYRFLYPVKGNHLTDQQIDHIGLQAIAILQRPRHVGRKPAFDLGRYRLGQSLISASTCSTVFSKIISILVRRSCLWQAMPVRSSPQISQECLPSLPLLSLWCDCCRRTAGARPCLYPCFRGDPAMSRPIRLRGRLAGVFAGLGRRLFQKDGTNQFQQSEHAAHQHFGLTGKVLLGRLSLEFTL